MKPLNQKEINEKFFNFMILFFISVAVFSFALYFNFSASSADCNSLRKKVENNRKFAEKLDLRFRSAEQSKEKLKAKKENGFKPGDKDQIAREVNKIYIADEDSSNSDMGIFKIVRDLLLEDISDIDSLRQYQKALDFANTQLQLKTEELKELKDKYKEVKEENRNLYQGN